MLRKRLALAVSILVVTSAGTWTAACGSNAFQDSGGGDASTSDGATLDQDVGEASSADAGPDSAPLGFCAGKSPAPAFCADFDESDPRTGFNDGTSTIVFGDYVDADGGNVGIVPGGEDGSRTLSAGIPDLPVNQAMKELVAATLPKHDGDRYHFGADLRFDHVGSVSGSSHVYLATFELDESASVHTTFDLVVYSSNVNLDIGDQTGTLDSILLGGVPTEGPTWYHLDVDVHVNGSVTATFNSVTDTKGANVTPSKDLPVIALGLRSAGNTGQLHVSYDNVTLDVAGADAGDGG